MATTAQAASAETTKNLVNYRTDGGIAIIEMNDPPANTYTYEMNRQMDECILKARMDNNVYVLLLTGNEPAFILRSLARLGEARIVCRIEDVPLLGDLEPELLFLSWTVELATSAGLLQSYSAALANYAPAQRTAASTS